MELDVMQNLIEAAANGQRPTEDADVRSAVYATIAALDDGSLRVAEQLRPGDWQVNAWTKQAILLYFGMQEMVIHEVGPFQFHDKVPLKKNLDVAGVRVVPPGTARYGSFLEPGVILMPGYVNIGGWVGAGTMVDTWATVGSCAQIGRNVHLAGGVGIGGVLEPPQAQPVIVEDNAFIGSRCIVVEGAVIEEEAVLGAGVMITASSRIFDVREGADGKVYRGRVPAGAVTVDGVYPRKFPGGEAHIRCAYIIGTRSERHDKNLSLEQALRDYDITV